MNQNNLASNSTQDEQSEEVLTPEEENFLSETQKNITQMNSSNEDFKKKIDPQLDDLKKGVDYAEESLSSDEVKLQKIEKDTNEAMDNKASDLIDSLEKKDDLEEE